MPVGPVVGGVQGFAVGEPQRDRPRHGRPAPGPVPQLGGGEPVDGLHGLVELPDAGEPGRERGVGRAEVGGLQQQPRGVRALRSGQGLRSGAELGDELAGEVALAVAEPGGQPGDALAVHHAVADHPHRPADQVGPDVPGGRAGYGVRTAAAAGPVAGPLGGGGRRVEVHVLPLGRGRRAAGTAVDAGGADGCEEDAVEACVAAAHGPVAGVLVYHAVQCAVSPGHRLAGIGHGGRTGGTTSAMAGFSRMTAFLPLAGPPRLPDDQDIRSTRPPGTAARDDAPHRRGAGKRRTDPKGPP